MTINNVVELQFIKNNEEVEAVTSPIIVDKQTNPIYKQLLQFHHAKIGEKLSIKDILR